MTEWIACSVIFRSKTKTSPHNYRTINYKSYLYRPSPNQNTPNRKTRIRMQAIRVIFKGTFDFGSPETVARILRQLEPRIINLYKEDFPWKLEELFPEGCEQIVFKPVSMQVTERAWKHALDGLEFLAQFALCGEVFAYKLGGGKRAGHCFAPSSEKAAVVLYQHAQEIEDPAKKRKYVDGAIKKYPAHTEALVLRAEMAMEGEDMDSARTDIETALERNPRHAQAWLTLAQIDHDLGEWDAALEHVNTAIKNSMPLQDIHWQARLLKARIQQTAEHFEQALTEWKALSVKLEKHPHVLPGMMPEVQENLRSCAANLDEEDGESEPTNSSKRLEKATA